MDYYVSTSRNEDGDSFINVINDLQAGDTLYINDIDAINVNESVYVKKEIKEVQKRLTKFEFMTCLD